MRAVTGDVAAYERARFLRGIGEPARVTQRLHRSGAAVDPAALVDRAADELAHGVAIEDFHGRAAPLPLFGPACDNADICGGECRLDPAAAPRVAVDLMALDEIEDDVRRASRDAHQMLAGLRPEFRDYIVGIGFEAGDDLAAIATGCAPAGFAGLEHDDGEPRLRQLQRGGESRIAGADDNHVGLTRRVERRRRPAPCVRSTPRATAAGETR